MIKIFFFVNMKKYPQNAILYNFEKTPKQINDIHISMTVLLIIPQVILVNINKLLQEQENFSRILNDNQK